MLLVTKLLFEKFLINFFNGSYSLELPRVRYETLYFLISGNFLTDCRLIVSYVTSFFERYFLIADIDWTIFSAKRISESLSSILFCRHCVLNYAENYPLLGTTTGKREITSFFADNILLAEETWPISSIPLWNILNGCSRNNRSFRENEGGGWGAKLPSDSTLSRFHIRYKKEKKERNIDNPWIILIISAEIWRFDLRCWRRYYHLELNIWRCGWACRLHAKRI